jgi:hypothetical protein
MRTLRAFLADRCGAAASEMALMLPMLLAIMFGGFEAGHYFYTEQKIIKAVRDGARFAGRLQWASFPCDGSIDPTSESDIVNVTRTGTLDDQADPRIAGWDADLIVVTYACDADFEDDGIFKGTTGGAPVVQVSATAEYPSLFETLGFIDSTASVAASAQAVVNGI